jgi:hypothetical protein
MGARNVSAVFAMWADLAPLPKLLLVWMALKSLDVMSKEGKPPRLYYDGEESLIVASGRGRSQVYTALKVLRDRGAIEVLEAGRMKHRAVYKLRLNPLEKSVPVSGNPDARVSGKPDAPGSGNPDSSVRKTGPLGGTKEATEESRPGETSPPEVPHLQLVPPVDNPEIDYSTAQQIVQAALGIEQAAARIRELTADGTDYTAAMVTLAHQIGDKPA